MKNIKEIRICKLNWNFVFAFILEQWKGKCFVIVVENVFKKKAVQDFIKRCLSLCLHTVKNSDLWFSEESSGWKRIWCFSRIQSLQMLVVGFHGGAFIRISYTYSIIGMTASVFNSIHRMIYFKFQVHQDSYIWSFAIGLSNQFRV